MGTVTFIIFTALLAKCLACLDPFGFPTSQCQDLHKSEYSYEVPQEYAYEVPHVPIKSIEVYGVPKYEVKTYLAPAPYKPAEVYGVPEYKEKSYEVEKDKKNELFYKYILTDTHVKPVEVYGVPKYEVKTYPPSVPVRSVGKKYESFYKYILTDTPKPTEVPSKPAFVYGVPEEYKPVPAKVYGVPK